MTRRYTDPNGISSPLTSHKVHLLSKTWEKKSSLLEKLEQLSAVWSSQGLSPAACRQTLFIRPEQAGTERERNSSSSAPFTLPPYAVSLPPVLWVSVLFADHFSSCVHSDIACCSTCILFKTLANINKAV